jgi:glycerol kinase
MSLLVIDVGTTGVRAAVMTRSAELGRVHHRRTPPNSPAPGLVEFDADAMAAAAIAMAVDAIGEHAAAGGDAIEAVGVSTQRASTVLWSRSTGRALAPGLGWQDLRTVFDCITARHDHGLALAPNQTATKAVWLLANAAAHDPADLCVGTVDTWMAWVLTEGVHHVVDRSNAAVTGLTLPDGSAWSDRALDALRLPREVLPRIVDTIGVIGAATALPGAPMLAALVGDQQASLVGQSCVRPGQAKITFGTGGMCDVVTGIDPPQRAERSGHGTFPIVAWSHDGAAVWGAEAIMLSAGTNVDWLRDDLGIVDTSAETHDLASSVASSDGVVYVPALLGLGTPQWDYGARGTLLGITRGTTLAHVCRAVLEGVAHRGADLVEAVEAETGLTVETLRIDGGMSRNPTFCQALSDAADRPVEIASTPDATTLGAGYLAGVGVGVWSGTSDLDDHWRPAARYEPARGTAATVGRDRWHEAVGRSRGWIPDLSALDF